MSRQRHLFRGSVCLVCSITCFYVIWCDAVVGMHYYQYYRMSKSNKRQLCDYYVWRWEEHCNSCNHCEQCKDDEAQSVDHHCGELPVVRHFRRLVLFPQLVCNHAEFLEDECKLSVRAEARRTPTTPVEQRSPTSSSIIMVCMSTSEKSCCRNRARRLECTSVVSEIIVDV